MSGKWKKFEIDLALARGPVESFKDWQHMIAPYQRQGAQGLPLLTRRGPDLPDGTPVFGLGGEYTGPRLKEWAAEQGMSLSAE